MIWLLAHLAGITQAAQYSLQVQVGNKKALLNPEIYLYYYNCATGMPRVYTLSPPF